MRNVALFFAGAAAYMLPRLAGASPEMALVSTLAAAIAYLVVALIAGCMIEGGGR